MTSTEAASLMDRLRSLPKVELHNHLEGGAMFPDLALKFAKRNNMQLPFADEENAKAYYQFSSLDQFIDILRTTVATLNTAEDYADAVERHGSEAAKQNIRYHEIFFTYGLVAPRGVAWEAIIEGITEGRKRNQEIHGVETAFICDLDRTVPEDTALEHVRLAVADMDSAGIVGLGLDCQERGYPASRLRKSFDLAQASGLRLTAHAGEDGGAESVWDALDCGVERIDHGVQAATDPALLKLLADRQILLTVCPISNIALKVFPSMQDHSLPTLLAAGIPVCVNSDDPPMFDCNLMAELAAIESAFGLTEKQLQAILRNALQHSFQQPEHKRVLLAEFDELVRSQGSDSAGAS